MILVDSLFLHKARETIEEVSFFNVDQGDLFVCVEGLPVKRVPNSTSVPGLICPIASAPPDLPGFAEAHGCSVIILVAADGSPEGVVLVDGRREERRVQVVEIADRLHSRIRGLYETDKLASKSVLVVGLGSGGSSIALELAKAGVDRFFLVDGDRLEVENLVRHVCGFSDLGRYKTKAVRDLILQKNPNASVTTAESNIRWEQHDELCILVRQADLVLCCTDDRASRQQTNIACLAEGRTAIYGGTFRRAYGGHVLRVVPGKTLCYQCFLDLCEEKDLDREIPDSATAERYAYSDRPVDIEPGLSSDIAPIANFCVKLGLLELLKDQQTTLSPLFEDLPLPWYQWLNRREAGTDYEALPPLDSGADALRILAWYGIEVERNPFCPACGDFAGRFGLSVPKELEDRFRAEEE